MGLRVRPIASHTILPRLALLLAKPFQDPGWFLPLAGPAGAPGRHHPGDGLIYGGVHSVELAWHLKLVQHLHHRPTPAPEHFAA
ncbi:MAG TPA: hypothetical protein VGC15_15235 [Acetobacteraceae bacterium]